MPMMMKELEKVTGGTEPMITSQEVVYYDANGNKYTLTVKPQELPDISGAKVSYSNGNGTTFTLEQ